MSFFTWEGSIRTRSIVIISVIALAVIIGAYYRWFPISEAPLEVEYVTSPSLDVLDTPAVVHKVLEVKKYGDRLEVLRRAGNWAKVRTRSGNEGWVITKELIPSSVYEGGQKLLQELRGRQAQAAGHTVLAANIHLEPQRGAPDLGMLTQGQNLEIFDRRMVARTPARSETKKTPSSAPAGDVWYQVQAGPRAGWVLGRMVTLDVPEGISQYAAEYNIVAWFVLNTVKDGDTSVPQYLAADREGSVEFDFTRVRVFTWSVRAHHYVTSFVKSGLSGNFPIKVEHTNDVPYFRLRLVDRKGNKFQSVYGLFNTIVRPLGTVKGWESTEMPGRQGRR
ncbi:MAG TPA: SH3 domain-containing protein [Terriglobia bacterium]|nr:SH3 domain-containing protein [Terriglobia bacterium]